MRDLNPALSTFIPANIMWFLLMTASMRRAAVPTVRIPAWAAAIPSIRAEDLAVPVVPADRGVLLPVTMH